MDKTDKRTALDDVITQNALHGEATHRHTSVTCVSKSLNTTFAEYSFCPSNETCYHYVLNYVPALM